VEKIIPCHPELVSGTPAIRQDSLQQSEMLNQASPDQHDKKEIRV